MVMMRKSKVRLHVVKACKGNRGKAPLVHGLGARWRWMAMSGPSHFLPRNKFRYPFTRRLPGGRFTACLDVLDKRNIHFPWRNSNPGPSNPGSIQTARQKHNWHNTQPPFLGPLQRWGLMQLHTADIDCHKPFPTTPAGLVQGILEVSPSIYESEWQMSSNLDHSVRRTCQL